MAQTSGQPGIEEAARERLAAAGPWELLARRQAGETLREVFRAGELVIKRYTLPADAVGYRRPWEREHAALERIGGRGAPVSHGWIEEVENGERVVIHLRSHVPGRHTGPLEGTRIEEAADLLAGFHETGVITDDALAQNFMVDESGRLFFVDLGRARRLSRLPLLRHAGIGLDLSKLRSSALEGDPDRWRRFVRAYGRRSGLGPLGRALVVLFVEADLARRRSRRRRRGR